MKRNKIALNSLCLFLVLISFIACDKSFATLESDVITNENAANFDIENEQYDIITYNKVLGPVRSDRLDLSTLGFYQDDYGTITSSFLSQATLSTFEPVFGDEPIIDSVVFYLPFFSFSTEVEEDGNVLYNVDSVIGRESIRLSLFESNYFIRDFNPNGDFSETQVYFSNKSASETELISEALLEAQELIFVEYNNETGQMDPIDNEFSITDNGYVLTAPDSEEDEDDLDEVIERAPPGIRVLLDPEYWQTKIIDKEGDAVLSGQNAFSDYLRGLYLKAESINNNGSYMFLNTASIASNIRIYYTRLTASTQDDEDEREQATFDIRFGPTRINFLEKNLVIPLTDGDADNGDSRIYLKGGEGSIAKIKLFNGDNVDDDEDTMNSFEIWKNEFVETDENGNFIRSKRLVNEANLVFYVDQDLIQDNEPDRIYLYNIENKTPLVDYFLDGRNNSLPSFSLLNHLGPLERVDDEPDGDGIKYKLKITEHVNNMLLRDSTNVELGLSVSLNVNLEEFGFQREVQSQNETDLSTPVSSVLSPRGTILHGSNSEDESKKVYLEIYYTEPNN